MLELLLQWYRRRFTDPQVIALLVILLAGFCILYFFSGILAPLLAAIVLAYLLEWPTARLQRIGCSRPWAASIVLVIFGGITLLAVFVVAPTVWQQGNNLISDMPKMLNKFNPFGSDKTTPYIVPPPATTAVTPNPYYNYYGMQQPAPSAVAPTTSAPVAPVAAQPATPEVVTPAVAPPATPAGAATAKDGHSAVEPPNEQLLASATRG